MAAFAAKSIFSIFKNNIAIDLALMSETQASTSSAPTTAALANSAVVSPLAAVAAPAVAAVRPTTVAYVNATVRAFKPTLDPSELIFD